MVYLGKQSGGNNSSNKPNMVQSISDLKSMAVPLANKSINGIRYRVQK
jgi:hypothetical protein